jgi:hypothetical protein
MPTIKIHDQRSRYYPQPGTARINAEPTLRNDLLPLHVDIIKDPQIVQSLVAVAAAEYGHLVSARLDGGVIRSGKWLILRTPEESLNRIDCPYTYGANTCIVTALFPCTIGLLHSHLS